MRFFIIPPQSPQRRHRETAPDNAGELPKSRNETRPETPKRIGSVSPDDRLDPGPGYTPSSPGMAHIPKRRPRQACKTAARHLQNKHNDIAGHGFFCNFAPETLVEKIMSHNLLKGKRGIIFGALNEMSIAWKVAERAVEEGASITLSNTPVALRMGELDALAEKTHAQIIPADATNVDDLKQVFEKSMEILGGKIDFVLHSIGMSPNVRKKRTYDDLDYDMLSKTLDISAVSFHKMMQTAKKMDAIAEYGSIVALSYVAAQRTFFGYNDMADAKSLLESIARSFGYIYGREKNVRVNTISQSPTMTTAGSGVKGMNNLMDFANKMSPLGNATADECADYCVMMFSDFTRKVTMQNLYHDGGFSSMGMSLRAMNQYSKSLDEYKDKDGHIIYG